MGVILSTLNKVHQSINLVFTKSVEMEGQDVNCIKTSPSTSHKISGRSQFMCFEGEEEDL